MEILNDASFYRRASPQGSNDALDSTISPYIRLSYELLTLPVSPLIITANNQKHTTK